MKEPKREMPKQLAIGGKVISIEKIGEKTQAQFAAQLKQNGIVLEEERLASIYTIFHDMAVKAAEEEVEVESTNTKE